MGRTANVRKKKSGRARVKTRIGDAQIKRPPRINELPGAIEKMKANAGKPGYDQYGQLANTLENRGGRGANTLGTTVFSSPAKPGRGRAETNMPKKGKGNRRAVDGGGFRNKAFGMG